MTPPQRRAKGTGSVYQRSSDNMWCAVIELPREGTKRRKKMIVRARKQDVLTEKRRLEKELARAGDLVTSSPTLAMWLDTWIDRKSRSSLKPRTATTYRGYIDRYIKPTIGRIRLDKLTAAHVERLHDAMTTQGLSSTTALQAHRILAKALTDAERAGKVTRNVATLTDAPRKAYAPRDALTADEARTLLLSVASDPAQAAGWAVALLAGLRQGERLGLTRDAIDLDTGILTVSWQLQRLKWQHGCRKAPCGLTPTRCPERTVAIPSDQEAKRVHGGLWMTRPKSSTGWREVPLAAPLHAALTLYLEQTTPGDQGLIFHNADGRPIDPSRDSAAWHAALDAAGLPPVPLHSARHTTSTLLFKLGVTEQTRMKILGHSSAAVTRNYTHVADEETRDAMVRLGGLIAPQLEGR